MSNNIIHADIRFDSEGLQGSLWAILYNIRTNRFTLKDESGVFSTAPHNDLLDKSRIIAATGASIIWYLHKDSASMKVEIQRGQISGSITIVPIEPYKMKYAIDNEIERIDLGFYIQCCIELCENFLVSDIKAE